MHHQKVWYKTTLKYEITANYGTKLVRACLEGRILKRVR